MGTWLDFWNRPNRIYVNDRHLACHYRQVADDLLSLAPAPDAVLLDFGCGEATEAGRVADAVGRLHLYDAAPATRERLRARHGDHPRIAVLDDQDYAGLGAGSLDLIAVNSVAQYLSRDELDRHLARWRALLRPTGRLVVADVIPPETGAVADAVALLRAARRGGFLLAAVAGLAATAVSDYRRIRRALPLTTWRAEDMIARAARHGLDARREPRNLGFNQRRMTFTMRPAGAPA